MDSFFESTPINLADSKKTLPFMFNDSTT